MAPAAPTPAPEAPARGAGLPGVGGVVSGRDGTPRSGAIVTLVGADGEQVGHTTSGGDGSYELRAPSSGSYLLICQGVAGDGEPQAIWISIDGTRTRHDIVLAGQVGSHR
jgi:hypothetical protein